MLGFGSFRPDRAAVGSGKRNVPSPWSLVDPLITELNEWGGGVGKEVEASPQFVASEQISKRARNKILMFDRKKS